MLQIDELKSQIGDIKEDIDDLYVALNIEGLDEKINALNEVTLKADFWNDMGAAQKTSQELAGLKATKQKYEGLVRAYDDAAMFAQMIVEEGEEDLLPECGDAVKKLAKDTEEMRLLTLLSGDYDKNNAILTFHAGAGGTEAQDWAEMLYRMYTRWAERSGFSYKVLDYLSGDEAGLKSASIQIEGENVYGYIKSEAGVHRLVRVSPFDSSGRRHTSFAALEVVPEIHDSAQIDIRSEDLKIDTYRSGGAGGQHVNKTESAVRVTHIPTGIVVACQNERSQIQNRETAMKMLKGKLAEIKEREHLEKIEDIKGGQAQIGWGSQIRSYVFMPYTMVKDHRTGYEMGNVNAVMDGDLDGFVNAYLKASANGTLKKVD